MGLLLLSLTSIGKVLFNFHININETNIGHNLFSIVSMNMHFRGTMVDVSWFYPPLHWQQWFYQHKWKSIYFSLNVEYLLNADFNQIILSSSYTLNL